MGHTKDVGYLISDAMADGPADGLAIPTVVAPSVNSKAELVDTQDCVLVDGANFAGTVNIVRAGKPAGSFIVSPASPALSVSSRGQKKKTHEDEAEDMDTELRQQKHGGDIALVSVAFHLPPPAGEMEAYYHFVSAANGLLILGANRAQAKRAGSPIWFPSAMYGDDEEPAAVEVTLDVGRNEKSFVVFAVGSSFSHGDWVYCLLPLAEA